MKKELIFLMDGFWAIGELKNGEVKKLGDIFKEEGFKEVWIVYSAESCRRLA